MRFFPATTEKHFAAAERIIAPYEKFCVSLADKVRTRDKNIFLLVAEDESRPRFFPSNFFLNKNLQAQNACGVIFAHGTLFHCLPFIYNAYLKFGNAEQDAHLKLDFLRSLRGFLVGKKITCISGTKTESEIFVDAIANLADSSTPVQINDYTLMSYKAGTALAQNGAAASAAPRSSHRSYQQKQVTVQRARRTDADALFDLHAGYVKEEVLPRCRTFNAAGARYELEQLLATRTEFFAKTASGKIVAKGGIHSEGQHHAQIGGVYTLPAERGKGFAQSTMAVLVAEILRQKKQPVLFVKKANAPAISVYKKIGFVPECDYVIVYY